MNATASNIGRAIESMSARQRSYADEFSFAQRPNGDVEGWYGGELLAVWSTIKNKWIGT